jgi:hypothetical protein
MIEADLQVESPSGLVYSGKVFFGLSMVENGPFFLNDPVDQGGKGPAVKTDTLFHDKRRASSYFCRVNVPETKQDLLFFFVEPKRDTRTTRKNAIIPQERGFFSPWTATLIVQ